MNVELVKEYRFEAAHRLPCVAAGHKCANVHGHSYRVEIFITGPVKASKPIASTTTSSG